jgi:hypothetical protein
MDDTREWHGYWWLPETAADRVPGRLVVESDGSARLELTGGLDLVRDGVQLRAPVILGLAEGSAVTLLDCFTLTSRGGFFTRPEHFHRIHVHRVLIGVHADPEQTVFRSARVQIENLTSWLAFPVSERSPDNQDQNYGTSVNAVDPIQVEVEGWTIQARSWAQPFQLTRTREQDIVSSDITAYLFLTPASPVAAGEFDEMILRLMDLVTLASGEASGLISETLFLVEDCDHPNADGSMTSLPIEVESYGKRVHTAAPGAPAVPDHRFRFTCADRPFGRLVTEWMRVRGVAGAACNVYFGLTYSRPTFTETRLLMTAIAAESLHASLYGDVTSMPKERFKELRATMLAAIGSETDKRWLKETLRNAPSLRDRLRALAQVPDRVARDTMVPDIEAWAGHVVGARNGLAHTGDESGDTDIFRLERATSGLLALVLMAELGVPPETQRRAATNVLRLPEQ